MSVRMMALAALLIGASVAHASPIETLIENEARRQGIEPSVALAVARVESQLNPRAVGPLGEIGLFQIRPEFAAVSREALFDPGTNARVGIEMLRYYRDACPVQFDLTWVTCFNQGLRAPKYPHRFPYYRRVMEEMK